MNIGSIIGALTSAIKSIGSMQETQKVDTAQEKDTLKAMLSGVNRSAKNVGLDTVEIVNKEKAVLETSPFIDDAEILADLMSALAETDPDLNIEKVKKYNAEHPVLAEKNVSETITTSTDDGYIGLDKESFVTISEALGEDAEAVFRYMSDAITSGKGSRIANHQLAFVREIDGAMNVDSAIRELTV